MQEKRHSSAADGRRSPPTRLRRRAEDILQLITEATAPVTGDEFFRALMQKLATVLGVRWAFITKCLDYPTTRVRIIAFWSGDSFAHNHDIELPGTPCEQVIKEGKMCFYPRGVGQVFERARRLGRESYIGIPIFDSSGARVIGHITIQDDKEMGEEMLIESVFRVFAARAGAELQRMQAAEALRDSEEKYRLLIENQTDLVVKLDPEGTLLFASPSYKQLFADTEGRVLGTESLSLVHPSDRDATRQAWQGLLAPPYEAYVHQRAHTVKGWRWLTWRAKSVLGPDAAVREIVATGRDITELRQAEDILRLLTEATAPVTGEEFFRAMMHRLAAALNVRWAFVTECLNYPTTRVRMLAWWMDKGFGQNVEFDLKGTPCEMVIQEGKLCFYRKDVGRLFPEDKDIAELHSYVGIPIFDDSGAKVIGHIAIFDDKERGDELVVESVFRVFAARAGAEIQRLQAAAALHDSEEKYRLLIENQTDLVVKLDPEGTLLFASPSYCEIFGEEEGRFLGTTPLSLVHKDDRKSTRRAWEHLLEPPYSTYIRHRVRTASGWRWVAWRAKTVLDAGGQVQEIVATGRDVTEQRQAEEILRLLAEATAPVTGEEFFRAMMHRLAAALKVHSAFVTKCLDYPTTRVRILAYWKGEDFAENKEFDLAQTPCEAVIREGRLCFYRRALGQSFPRYQQLGRESYIGIPIFESFGSRVIGHIAIFDNEEMGDDLLIESVFRIFAARAGAELQRMQAAEALSASEERYRLLVENQTDMVVKVDVEGNLTFVSPSYCETFGRGEREVLGTSFLPSLRDEGSGADDAWVSLFHPPYRCQVERRAMTVHGWRWLAWAAKGMPDEHGRVTEVVAGGRDITEQKRAEEQTRRHLGELAHVSRLSSMGELTSALAHELNQPLASILSYAQACLRLLRSGKADAGELQAALRRVERNTERAGEIIRHLRDLMRKGEAQRTPVQVNYLVREIYRLLRPEARQQQITLLLDLASSLDPVEVDNIQIQQVILNFVRNGIDAINAGNGERREILIRTCRNDGGVEIAVSDSGAGISPEVAGRLFEPFITTKPHGMGIGLSISRSIVDAHGGRLWVTPNAERGTTFHMFLPGGDGTHENND